MQPSDDNDEIETISLNGAHELDAPRRRIVRRPLDELPVAADPYADDVEDEIPPRRLRWWHVAGALLLIGVLLLETLLPVIEGLLQLIRFEPSTLGQPL